jgi:tetratricopeptide (TPR) repeat protein
MADLIAQLCEIAATELQATPQVSTKQLTERLKASIEQNREWQAALKSDDRLIQINRGDATGFQTLVEGGIANIGVHLHGVDEAKLAEIVREVLKSFQPVGIPQNLPANGTATFVGRETDMEALHEQLQQREWVAVSAIQGMGGIGKTELALQYALHHLKEQTYPGGLCWLRSREEVGTQIVSFARSQLSLEPPDGLELLDQVRWCWRNWQAGEILTVFDDVQQYADVELFLPPAGEPRFKVLMTTRRSRIAASVQDFEIKVLNEASALNLLRALVADGRVDRDLETAKQLCEWLGWLPLGLELVGRYLARKKDVSLAKLWQRLQDKKLEAKALLEAEPGMTATLGVTAAFELSWQELNEEAQQLAALLSLFALAEIPWTLVQECLPEADEEELEDLRDEKLLVLSLLIRASEGMYDLHQLLREFFAAKRKQMAVNETLKQIVFAVVMKEARRVSQKPKESLIKEADNIIPHLREVVGMIESANLEPVLATGLALLAGLYDSLGRYSEAELSYQRTLEIDQRFYGEEHPEVATDLNNLAYLYILQGYYLEAEPLLLRSLSIREQQLGADHPDVASSLCNLADLYTLQGRHSEAEPLLIRSLSICEQQLEIDHPYVIQSLHNLALLYQSQGRYSEAEPLYQQSLSIREQCLGASHFDVAPSLTSLASLYELQGRYSEAEPLAIGALSIYEQHLGINHPNVALCLHNLATLYQSQERYSEAETLYLRSRSIYEQHLGTHYPDAAFNLSGLAQLYSLQERYSEAETLYLGRALFANRI